MGLFFGTRTTEPDTVYLGSKLINEVYWGNKKIYPVWQNRYFVSTRAGARKLVYSDNGINWQHASDSLCGSMAFDGHRFFAVPNWDTDVLATTSLNYSYNGKYWKTRTGLLTMAHWMSIAYGNGIFVAKSDNRGGRPELIATSSDGLNWTEQDFASSIYLRVRFLNGKFFIPPFYSINGINWYQGNVTNVNILTGETTITTQAFAIDVSYGNGIYVAIKNGYIYYSTNGINWFQINQLFSGGLNSIAFGNGIFVIVGKNKLYYSTNGLDWNNVSITGNWNSVVFGDKFVVVASTYNLETNKALYSTNGMNWLESILPFESDWGDVYYCQSV